MERFHQDDHCHVIDFALHRRPSGRRPLLFLPGGVLTMPGWLSLLCGVLVLVAAAYLLYVVLRPESF